MTLTSCIYNRTRALDLKLTFLNVAVNILSYVSGHQSMQQHVHTVCLNISCIRTHYIKHYSYHKSNSAHKLFLQTIEWLSHKELGQLAPFFFPVVVWYFTYRQSCAKQWWYSIYFKLKIVIILPPNADD